MPKEMFKSYQFISLHRAECSQVHAMGHLRNNNNWSQNQVPACILKYQMKKICWFDTVKLDQI